MRDKQTYIWRCVKCNNHFANIDNADGSIKQEKRCPKCKSVNTLWYERKEISIICKFYDPVKKGYDKERISKSEI